MKKLSLLLTAFVIAAFTFASSSFSFTPKDPVVYASQVFVPVGKDGNKISLLELSKISRSELEKMTGNKMNILEKRAFKKAQRKLEKGINDEGVITDKKMVSAFAGGEGIDGTTGFHLGG